LFSFFRNITKKVQLRRQFGETSDKLKTIVLPIDAGKPKTATVNCNAWLGKLTFKGTIPLKAMRDVLNHPDLYVFQ